MATLGTLLDEPVTWMDAATNPDIKAFLEDLQANILKGHGRHHSGHIFLSFAGMPPNDVAALVRSLGQHCTSAYHQLRSNKKLPPHIDGGPVRCLFLSASAYRALGNGVKVPDGDAFQAGMESRQGVLGDPPRVDWNEVGWRAAAPDALFLVADADQNSVTADLEATEMWLNGTGAKILVLAGYSTNMAATVMTIVIAYLSVFTLALNGEFHYPRVFAMNAVGPNSTSASSKGSFEIARSLDPKLSTIAIVGADAEFARKATDGARQNATAAGLKIVHDKACPPSKTDYAAILRAVRATNPEVIFVAFYPTDTSGILRAAAEMSLTPRLFGGRLVDPQKLCRGSPNRES
jgi:hypothetical protein